MSRKFTKTEIQKLTEAGISFQIEGSELIVAVPYEGALRDGLTGADIDHEATDKQVKAVCRMFRNVGGYNTGWGGWRLSKGYSSPTKGYDFNDVASPHHY